MSIWSAFFEWLLRDDSCPLEFDDKEWIEKRFASLAKHLPDPHGRRVILPTDEFFPDEFLGQPKDLWPMLERVCRYLGCDSRQFQLALVNDRDPPEVTWVEREASAELVSSPLEHRVAIYVGEYQLEDPITIAAGFARAVCALTLPELTDDEHEQEELIDLATIYCGAGVLAANATFRSYVLQAGQATWTRTHMHGVLRQRMYGCGLALFARARGEDHPEWANHLCDYVRVVFQQTMRFLSGAA